jgi:hypothetical protein
MFLPDSFQVPRRPFFVLLLLAASWYAIDRGVAVLIGREVLQSQFRFSRLYRGACDARVLILGNSRGVNGFYAPDLTDALGTSVFNLSYNGLSIRMARMLFEDCVAQSAPPDLLVVEVTNALDAAPSVGLCQLYADKSPRLAAAWREADPSSFWLSQVAANTLRYNGELTLRAFAFLGQSDQTWINRYQMPKGMMRGYVVPKDAAAQWDRLDSEAVKELRQLIETARSVRTRVLLIISPYAPGYREQLPGFEAWVAALEEATGQPVYDCSNAVASNECFADPLHMNLAGAREFMPQLVEIIRPASRSENESTGSAAGQDHH